MFDKINYRIAQFVNDDEGVTAVEYAVLAVLIIAAVAAAMGAFSTSLTAAFTTIGSRLTETQLGS